MGTEQLTPNEVIEKYFPDVKKLGIIFRIWRDYADREVPIPLIRMGCQSIHLHFRYMTVICYAL